MKRIYVVNDGKSNRLVRAASRIQAESIVAREVIKASLATQDELVKFIAAGVKIEEPAGEVQADLGY